MITKRVVKKLLENNELIEVEMKNLNYNDIIFLFEDNKQYCFIVDSQPFFVNEQIGFGIMVKPTIVENNKISL